MSDTKPVYLVAVAADPVVVRVEGRACFQNCRCLKEFFATMTGRGQTRFVLDLARCTGMDSTFLGVVAGAAIELRGRAPAGALIVRSPGPRNLELLRNLGLHRLLTVVEDIATSENPCTPLDCQPEKSELANARLALEAHQNLVAVDATNQARFEDVLVFLQNRVGQG